jgi:hypothetical protein
MKPPRAPSLENRRAKQLEAELFQRARAWIPAWAMEEDKRDFGQALLKIAARFGSEVTERLDRAGDRMRLAFLDWLAAPAEAARPARLPVVFKLTDSARDAVRAAEGTRLQVEAAGLPIILESEKDVLLLPGLLKTLVAVDAGKDAFFLPPPGLSSLAPLASLPTQWQLKSFTSAGATKLQLNPEQGLAVDLLVEVGGKQYRLSAVDKDIVTIEPPLVEDQPESSLVTKVDSFAPFDGAAQSRQEHGLYLGHKELFDIEAPATIEVLGATALAGLVAWEYWGKVHPQDDVAWQPLTPASADVQAKSDAFVLEKPKGAVELRAVNAKNSRWIRAVAATVQDVKPLLRADRLEVRINSRHGAPAPNADPPAAEGMANTTPLVLDGVFFPFGKEPRQFDAFYLGSKEAFSKKGADVVLEFDLADATFTALSAISASAFPNGVLAGVAKDGALYLLELDPATHRLSMLRDRGPLRPTPPGQTADVAAGLALDARPQGRLPVWRDSADPNGFLVAASAGDSVWVRREHSSKDASGWTQLSAVPSADAGPNVPISDLIYFADQSTLFALRGGQLSLRKWSDDTSWTPVETVEQLAGGKTRNVKLDVIVPILTASADGLAASRPEGMLGVEAAADVDAPRRLHQVSFDGDCKPIAEMEIDATVRPFAVRHGGEMLVALRRKSLPDAILFYATAKKEKKVGLIEPDANVVGFDALISGGQLQFLAAVRSSSGSYLASWVPTPGNDPLEPLRSGIPLGFGQAEGAPTQFAGHVAVPATGGHVLATDFDLSRRFERQADVSEVVFAPAPAAFGKTDVLVRELAADFAIQHVTGTGTTDPGGEAYFLLDKPFDLDAKGALYGFHTSSEEARGRVIAGTGKVQLDMQDAGVPEETLLLLKDGTLHRIKHVTPALVATVDPPAEDEDPGVGVGYWKGVAINGRVSRFMELDASNNDWPAAYLQHATLRFKNASPLQRGMAFSIDAAAKPPRPLLVELVQPWTSAIVPGDAASFLLDAAVGQWRLSLEDTSTNPELSWEYSNGTGWWKLVVTLDETRHLKTSGEIRFKVPLDIAPSDWAGRTNYWIRARLVGGDYGREEVSVEISPKDAAGKRTQKINRSTKDIHAPSIVKLVIRYDVCIGVLPELVLTSDSGSQRDQSDANRTNGAKVEAFVPLGVMLGRLSDASSAASVAAPCAPVCNCPGTASAPAVVGAAEPTEPAIVSAAPPVTGRAMYLGFDARLTGAPVKVLLLVAERPHDTFAPLIVEALIADRFVPIVVTDTTRALGETGVLSLAFSLEPTRRELFGQALTWLRLTPRSGADPAKWNPKILGAYFNAEWAIAAETLTYELLGSSQGEPDLTLFLAKPPVLRDTLELRVKEPLGDEERQSLKTPDARQVLSAVENLPGDWVLWRRVIDPLDEPPTERAYALDDATGEIRFGDGQHGRIPPVGRDSIVAFRYRRTEAGAPDSVVVPANAIEARTQLNLVSPVAGVEAVFAADNAAGGAPADAAERVLQFGVARLRHRERALTASDFEDLALESSPDIVQARCLLRKGFARLVVVMRGANPTPTAAQIRELRRVLLDDAPPSLSAKDALRIGGPGVRRLRVNLRLRVASLDDAGAVGDGAKSRLVALFDTATGGAEKTGWPLGENPTEGDIAMALHSVPRLEGIADVQMREIAADDTELLWPDTIKPTELAMLDEDVLRVVFEPIEVLA